MGFSLSMAELVEVAKNLKPFLFWNSAICVKENVGVVSSFFRGEA